MTLRSHSLIIALLLSSLASSQERGPGPSQPRTSYPISYEAIPLFGADGSAAINVHYRIGQRFFVFVRNAEVPREEFIAKGELLVELRAKDEAATARQIRHIRLIRRNQPADDERLDDIRGAFTFAVPEGEYTIIFSLDDRESGRSFLERNYTVTTRRAQPRPLDLSYPMFAQLRLENGEDRAQVMPMNRGTDVLHNATGGYVFQIYHSSPAPIQLQWKIEGDRHPLTADRQTVVGSYYTLVDGILSLDSAEGPITYAVTPSPSASWKLLYVPLPLERLQPGRFRIRLEISAGEERQEGDHAFQIVWPSRPSSLNSFQIAVEALRHIVQEEELAEMQTGSLERAVRAFNQFWRNRDPDTTTAYNEVMAEYYRRVDEAIKSFSTPSGPDGYKTDRGRIFILYGSPSHTQRMLPPGAPPTEIWTYERLKRRFIFADRYKTGNPVLVSAEDL